MNQLPDSLAAAPALAIAATDTFYRQRRRLREVCDTIAEITGRPAPDVLDELLMAAGAQYDRPRTSMRSSWSWPTTAGPSWSCQGRKCTMLPPADTDQRDRAALREQARRVADATGIKDFTV